MKFRSLLKPKKLLFLSATLAVFGVSASLFAQQSLDDVPTLAWKKGDTVVAIIRFDDVLQNELGGKGDRFFVNAVKNALIRKYSVRSGREVDDFIQKWLDDPTNKECTEDQCFLDVSRKFGTDHIIAVGISKLGGITLIDVNAFDLIKNRVKAGGRSRTEISQRESVAYSAECENCGIVQIRDRLSGIFKAMIGQRPKTPVPSNPGVATGATPTTQNATPTTQNATPTTQNATPTTQNATPTTQNATPTTQNATPTTEVVPNAPRPQVEAPPVWILNSEPAGAEIWINNRRLPQTTPAQITDYPAGTRLAVTLRKEARRDKTLFHVLKPGLEKSPAFRLETAEIKAFVLESEYRENAKIFVDGRDSGALAPGEVLLLAGKRKIEIRSPAGTSVAVFDVKDEPGQRFTVTVAKKPAVPPGMVPIPAGEFTMGSRNGDDDERPVHQVELDAFFIDVHEVTVEQYAKCVSAGKCEKADYNYWNGERQGNSGCNWGKAGRGNHPVNCVDWEGAKNFCSYADKRLPTEAEWERAATWKDGRKYKYPSGKDSLYASDVVFGQSGGTSSVGSKPREINGTYDMAGNVWEWVHDRYGDYPSGKQTNPQGPASGSSRVNRGGGWINDGPSYLRIWGWDDYAPSFLRGAIRYRDEPANRNARLGFRCVVSSAAGL